MPGMKMLPATLGRVLAATFAAAALAVPVLGAGPAGAASTPLPCRTSVNNTHPPQYTTVKVRVRTADKVAVKTVAHYKTTNHAKTSQAGRRGRLSVPYYISDATVGYKVVVDVTVSKGSRTGSCSTSFTPQAG